MIVEKILKKICLKFWGKLIKMLLKRMFMFNIMKIDFIIWYVLIKNVLKFKVIVIIS